MLDRCPLDEGAIKSIVLNEYRRTNPNWRGSVVANEFPLGTSSVRVDLAILGSEFIGIEIKSELDTLKRLSTQIDAYSRYFDRVIAVVADRHLRKLDWKSVRVAEIWKVDRSGRLKVAAEASEFGDSRCWSDLMNQQQLRRHGLIGVKDPDHAVVRDAFAQEFRSRFLATSDAFWEAVDGRPIEPHDFEILSRFRDRRATIAAWQDQRSAEWSNWISAVNGMAISQSSSDQSSSVS